MMQEFDILIKKRSELLKWWGMRNAIARYDNKPYLLVTRFSAHPEALQFCGQQYAGDKNYHECPAWFVDCFLKELENRKYDLAGAAFERAIEEINAKIDKLKKSIMAELESSNLSQ
jgi:hypothetical protein